MELIKYSPDCILIEICNNVNNILENHANEINFGHLILLPIQKFNKEKGPPYNLRPLNLLDTIRKITVIIMKRIKSKVESYILYSQSACKANIPTAAIIWAHRFIIVKIMFYQNIDVQITGLDM